MSGEPALALPPAGGCGDDRRAAGSPVLDLTEAGTGGHMRRDRAVREGARQAGTFTRKEFAHKSRSVGRDHMSTPSPIHRVAIVGVYNTRQARHLEGETSLTITLDAVRGAMADAGIGPGEVDGVSVSGGLSTMGLVHLLGGRPSWTGGGGIGIPSVLEAAAAIAAGYCETVVLGNGQAGQYTERTSTAPWTRPENEFVECWGL